MSFAPASITEVDIQDDWSRKWALLPSLQRCHPWRPEGGQSSRLEELHLLTVIHQTNVLFDSAGIPRLTDFGNSVIDVDEGPKELRGFSLRWAAPEILEGLTGADWCLTKMSDVYAFGMVVIEVQLHHRFHQLMH